MRTTLLFGAVFVGVPLAEALILMWLGSVLGIGWTFAIVLVTGVVGGWLAKREGLTLLRQLSAELSQGLPPGARLTEGALVVVGGILLLTPGVLTDLAGVLLMIRPTRRWLAPRVLRALTSRFSPVEPEIDLGDGVRVRTQDSPPPERSAPRSSAANPFANKFDDLQ